MQFARNVHFQIKTGKEKEFTTVKTYDVTATTLRA